MYRSAPVGAESSCRTLFIRAKGVKDVSVGLKIDRTMDRMWTDQLFTPVFESKICTVLLHPVASHFPSWENLTQQTTLSWTSVCTRPTSRTRLAVGLQRATQSLPSFLSSLTLDSGSMSLEITCGGRAATCWPWG